MILKEDLKKGGVRKPEESPEGKAVPQKARDDDVQEDDDKADASSLKDSASVKT